MNSILYANRALAYSKINKDSLALEDLNKSIELNEGYSKAYLRRSELRER
jgi:DnaJ family protein C protein 7